eukprot:m.19419 g.19419  ORF g.19419 m.19419 type:complete len:264 (-) comp10900_c0_seq1:30-821(-)
MKVTIKTIKDGTFSIELEPSATIGELKTAVQAEKGDGYPAEGLKVIYQGKVLDNAQTLEGSSYKEAGFLVVMATKAPKKAAAPAAATPATTTSSSSAATAPATASAPPPASEPSGSMETAQDTPSDAPAQSSGESLPRELPANSPLAFLGSNPNFVRLRGMVQQQPEMLPSMLQQIAGANPELVELINANQEDFYILINAEDDGELGMPAQPSLQLSPEDQAAVERLAQLGFDPSLAAQAYFACEKNENMAANWLFENGADMQ